MFTESTVRPALVERYPSLVRINYGVVEEKREGMDEEPMTFFVYQMVELENTDMSLEELESVLINDRYPLEEQVKILTGNGDVDALNLWRSLCKKVAREVLGMPVTIESAKEEKLNALEQYDKSDAVNGFTFQGVPMWLKFDTRKDMRMSVDAAIKEGRESVAYWDGNIKYEMPAAVFDMLLSKLEIYAIDCFNVTASHKVAIGECKTIEEVEEYDFTTGYPAKLAF